MRWLAALAAVLAGLAGCGGSAGGELTVFAASSLAGVLPRLEPDARYSFGGSNELAIQIEQGAPADVFLSAAPRYTRALFERALVEEPFAFARNELALVVPRANPAGIEALEDVARPGVKLVVAAPEVPVGAYTRELLDRLGLAAALDRVVSEEPDVKSVLAKVAAGEADAGLVYRTDAAAGEEAVATVELPAQAQPGALYEAAVVASSPRAKAARAFVARLAGTEAQQALRQAGFLAP